MEHGGRRLSARHEACPRDPSRRGPACGRTLGPVGVVAAALVIGFSLGIAPLRAGIPADDQGAASDPGAAVPKKAASTAPLGKVIVQWDHLVDSNDKTFEDGWAFVSYKQSHFQVWEGEFTKGAEIGGYLRDHRRSTYSGLYRFRNNFDHVLQFDTEQVLKKGFVLAVMLRGIHVIPDDPTVDKDQLQFGTGLDWYWGDYNFLSFRAITDPRESGRWSFITSHRFQRDPAFYVQPGLIIRTDRSTGWFVQGKIRWFRWGVGSFDRFDWTATDRTIYSAGVEWTY